jgi:hypothetical protein
MDGARVTYAEETAIAPKAPLDLPMANGGNMRVTDETPRRMSVFDLIVSMTGSNKPDQVFANLLEDHAELCDLVADHQFPGAGQIPTPVCDVSAAIKIMMLVPGRAAARFRENVGERFMHYMGDIAP